MARAKGHHAKAEPFAGKETLAEERAEQQAITKAGSLKKAMPTKKGMAKKGQ